MKELYISPELEILCFLPMEGIASEPLWNNYTMRAADNGVSTGGSYDTDQDDTVDNSGSDGNL